MDLRYLQEFLSFAEDMNYSAAAKRLFISRPTLSEHLSALESELQCQLIDHGTKPQLTHQGRKFLQTAKDFLQQWDEIVSEYSTIASNLLTIKVSSTNLPWIEKVLLQARQNITKEHPASHISIVTENGPLATTDALDIHGNDITIVGYKQFAHTGSMSSSNERPSLYLGTEETHLLMMSEHPLFERETILPEDLSGFNLLVPQDVYQSYTRDNVEVYLTAHGAAMTLKTLPFQDHYEYFAHGFGKDIGVAPHTLISRFGLDTRSDCRIFTMKGLPLMTDFKAIFRDDFIENPRGRRLFEEMKRLIEAN